MKSVTSKMVKTLLILLLVSISGACWAQSMLKMPVSLPRQNGTVGDFLKDLNKLPGIAISYSSQVVDLSKQAELSGNERTVEDILRSVLRSQPLKIIEQNGKIFLAPTSPVKRKFTISGYITDKETGERLIGASVYIPSKQAGTTSNVYGFFSITLDQDSLEIQASYAGYFPLLTSIDLQQDMELNIAMER